MHLEVLVVLLLAGKKMIVEKLWENLFANPLQWWDHRSKKVIEHQSCQNSHVNAAIALVGVDLVRCLLVAILPW